MEGYDLIRQLQYSEAVDRLSSLGKFINIHYLFELGKSIQECIRPIYSNEFRTIRSIIGSYLDKVRVTENLNKKINAEVDKFLGVGAALISDLRDCGYPSKSTRCADP